jgi:hypothetical protein
MRRSWNRKRRQPFRLDDSEHYEELKSFLVRYAARGEPVNYVKNKTPLISPGRLGVIMFALVIAYMLVTAYVEGMPTINPPNDHKCDYDGVTSAFEFYTIDTAGNEATARYYSMPRWRRIQRYVMV